MEVLNTDSILTQEQIENLFMDTEESQETPPEKKENGENKENKEETIEVNPDTLFINEEEPESVDSGKKNIEEQEDATSTKESTSPNFYSSIAKALKEDSIFPDLDPENIKDAEAFASMFEEQLQARLEDRVKKFNEAINAGVEPSVAGKYERTLQQLNAVTSDSIKEDGNENLRKELIYLDLINKGYTDAEAKEEVEEVIESGTDIRRAERALKNNISFYKNKYEEEINLAKEEAAKFEKERKERAESLKKDMLGNSAVFEGLEVTAAQRQKAFDAISKPIYKDPDTGDYLTAIQKYETEHREEFLKKLGFIFVLTDNFKSLDKLVKGKVNKESKRAIRELENTLNNTQRTSSGSLKYVSGVAEDPESIFKNYSLDLE